MYLRSEILKGKTVLEIEKVNSYTEVFYFTDGSKLIVEAEGDFDTELIFRCVETESHTKELEARLIELNKKISLLISEENILRERLERIQKK